MSFDLHLIAFKDGGPASFPKHIVEKALGPFIQSRDSDFCVLAFPDGGGGEMFDDEEETETDSVSISRGSGLAMYDALYEILSQTHSALMWSFGGCVVADASVIPDLPDGLIEDLGQPTVVTSGTEIAAAVAET